MKWREGGGDLMEILKLVFYWYLYKVYYDIFINFFKFGFVVGYKSKGLIKIVIYYNYFNLVEV